MKAKTTAIQVRVDAKHKRLTAELALRLDSDVSKVIRLDIRELAKKHKIT